MSGVARYRRAAVSADHQRPSTGGGNDVPYFVAHDTVDATKTHQNILLSGRRDAPFKWYRADPANAARPAIAGSMSTERAVDLSHPDGPLLLSSPGKARMSKNALSALRTSRPPHLASVQWMWRIMVKSPDFSRLPDSKSIHIGQGPEQSFRDKIYVRRPAELE